MILNKDSYFTITEETLNKCMQFAKDSVTTSIDKYARRNQNNVNKIIEDIRNGKLAEEYVWQELKELYPNLSKPDYNIYDKKQKNWDADLKDPSVPLKIAVKSQEIKSEMAYGRSWVFQFRPESKFDTDTGIFGKQDNEDHYVSFVSFVSLNVAKRIGYIRALVKVNWLHQNKLFKAMQLKNLQNNKIAVYFSDLEKLTDQLYQLH